MNKQADLIGDVKLTQQYSVICDSKGWLYYKDSKREVEAIINTDEPLPPSLDLYQLRDLRSKLIYLSTPRRTILNKVY